MKGVPLRYLLDVLPFGDVFVAHLHPGVAQPLEEVGRVQPHQVSRLIRLWGHGGWEMRVGSRGVHPPLPLPKRSRPSVPSGSACSSRCFCLNFMLPKCMMAPVSL